MTHKTPADEMDHDRVIRSEERLCQMDDKWVAHAQVHELEANALRLQHSEYERRLEELNHENARVQQHTAQFASRESVDGSVRELTTRIDAHRASIESMLPREVFEQTQREVLLRAEALALTVQSKPNLEQHDALSARVQSVEDWKNRATGAAVILTLFAGAVGAVIAQALGS